MPSRAGPAGLLCVVVGAGLLVGSSAALAGQTLRFTVTQASWQRETLESQRRANRAEAEEHEVLFCIESWTTTTAENGVEITMVRGIRREESGRKHRISSPSRLRLAAKL